MAVISLPVACVWQASKMVGDWEEGNKRGGFLPPPSPSPFLYLPRRLSTCESSVHHAQFSLKTRNAFLIESDHIFAFLVRVFLVRLSGNHIRLQ